MEGIFMAKLQPISVNTPSVRNNVSLDGQNIQEKTEHSKTKKYLYVGLGAVAVAASAIAGIALHNKAVLKNAEKAVEALKKEVDFFVDDKNITEEVAGIFDNKILQKYIDEAMKLPLKERVKKLTEIVNILKDDRDFSLAVKKGKEKFIETLPKEIKDLLASKDQLKITKAYAEYCDNLFYKSETAGATIQESVDNVFGKRINIKPHTYDLSKEADRIATAQNTGAEGYIDITVRADNMIADGCNHANTIGVYGTASKPKGVPYVIKRGMSKDGTPYVQITFDDLRSKYSDARNAIRLLSPGKDLTPAQMDLLKLEEVNDLPVHELQILTYGKNKTNFDAILSFIQTMANSVK